MIGRTNPTSALSLAVALIALLWCVASANAGPITTPHAHESDLHHAVHDVAHAVDDAWDVFHQAALSGTLASPVIQTQVEQHLHKSRSLLLEARSALAQDDRETVQRIVGQIHELTSYATTLSQERKR